MDVDDFLCSLQEHYFVHLPVFAVRRPDGSLATENATDGTRSLVLLTDHDLLERYLVRVRRGDPVRLSTPAELGGFLAAVDRLGLTTHVCFDPTPSFHRRFPLDVVRAFVPAP